MVVNVYPDGIATAIAVETKHSLEWRQLWQNNGGKRVNNNFMTALKFTSKWEGGFSNDKVDPGGKTKFGISDAGDGTVDGLVDIDRNGTGDVPVEDLTLEQAVQVYYNAYWKPSGCDSMELPMAVAVFDTAVNCGVGRCKKWLDQAETAKEVLDLRRAHYYRIIDGNPKLRKFLKGWLNRLNDLHKYVEILSN